MKQFKQTLGSAMQNIAGYACDATLTLFGFDPNEERNAGEVLLLQRKIASLAEDFNFLHEQRNDQMPFACSRMIEMIVSSSTRCGGISKASDVSEEFIIFSAVCLWYGLCVWSTGKRAITESKALKLENYGGKSVLRSFFS